MQGLMDEFLLGLKDLPVEVVAKGVEKVPHIIQLRTPGRKGEDMVIAMDVQGVAVSQGSACSSGRIQASHVLQAMGWDAQAAGEGLRVSMGWATTAGDVAAGLAAIGSILAK